MKSISGKKLCKVLQKHGWLLARFKGSHHIFTKPNVSTIITVPVYGSRDLPIGTLKGILKDANLTEDDLA